VTEKEKVFILEDPVVREQVATILRRGIARAEVARELKRQHPCRHCSHAIVRSDDNRWVHVDGERRGCRAASRVRSGTWDDKLNREWTATPSTPISTEPK